jgi:predicted ATPase
MIVQPAGAGNMIDSLHLERFKNFRDATLRLGPLTILIGANASGKSNIRDAFRFLHGIGRGYTLAEILGEKYVGGDRAWSGIRGGTREVAYSGSDSFALGVRVRFTGNQFRSRTPTADYSIIVGVDSQAERPPQIEGESLKCDDRLCFSNDEDRHDKIIKVHFQRESGERRKNPPRDYVTSAPVVQQFLADDEFKKSRHAWLVSRALVQEFESFRFLDLSPTQMRIPSLPGQTTLGDRGENLSSVLASICEDPSGKETLLEWVRKLTPMDVADLEFDRDAAGRILLRLKEWNGGTISALSASDGTLRFLGVLAALFGPTPASFSFIEELENGIHPTRLGLLMDLIESQTRRRDIQVVATTHSPLLLQFLSDEALNNASIVYRLPDHPEARIKRILDIPDARRVIKEQSVSLLHASSWFEDVLDFTEDSEPEPVAAGHQV